MSRVSLVLAASVLISLSMSQTGLAAGMDGRWTGALSGEKGSGPAEIVISGKTVTYSYQQSAVPVEWAKVGKTSVSFGAKLYKLTLTAKGSASFVSQQYGNATGTLTKQ